MTEIKPLTEQNFDEFLGILEEINDEPLESKSKRSSKEDFVKSRYVGFLFYENGILAGIAIVIDSYSAVHARRVLNLDEFYIRESFRKKGLGKKLFDYVVEYAKEKGYMRLEWRVEKDNRAAHNLYSQYEADTNWTFYAMRL